MKYDIRVELWTTVDDKATADDIEEWVEQIASRQGVDGEFRLKRIEEVELEGETHSSEAEVKVKGIRHTEE